MPHRRRISRKIDETSAHAGTGVASAVGADVGVRKREDGAAPGARLLRGREGERLLVTFVSPTGSRQAFDFSRHLGRRDLAVHFADAFYGWGVEQGATTRLRKKPFLDRFFEYLGDLEERNPSSSPVHSARQIDTTILNGYAAWLDEPKLRLRGHHKGSKVQWAIKSRSMHFGIVSALVAWLKRHRRWCLPDDCEVPWAPWPTADGRSRPTAILTPQQVAEIESACLREIDATWQAFETGRRLLGRPADAAADEDRRLARLLHYFRDVHGSVIKGARFLPKRWKIELHALGGSAHIRRHLGATAEALVPYAVYVVSRGFFNTEAILGANRHDIVADHPLFDERKVVWLAKGRAVKDQRRSFDTRRSRAVPNLIEQVRQLTEPLLPFVAATPLQDRLFMFAGGQGSAEAVLAFIGRDGLLDTYLWTNTLKRFRERNGLPYFTLGMLRKTGSDRVHEATDGDIKASQALLGHASANTTYTSYNTDGMRRRDALKIAMLQAKLVDWSRTEGRANPAVVTADLPDLTAEQAEAVAAGANAVASGFTCRNPYDSPQKGQRKDRVCTEWLGCFTCSGAVVERNAETLARLLQLRGALRRARLRVDPVRFELLYREKLRLLEEEVLTKFSDRAMWAKAKAIAPTLVPLPEVE